MEAWPFHEMRFLPSLALEATQVDSDAKTKATPNNTPNIAGKLSKKENSTGLEPKV